MQEFSKVVGQVLRRARLDRALTLQGVQVRSGGRFKPSVLGSYERGERAIPLARFCDLAGIYGLSPEQLLAQVVRASLGVKREAVIRLDRLSGVPQQERQAVAEFIHRVKTQRGDYVTDVITLRSGDLESIALGVGETPRAFRSRLRPAMITG